MKLNGHVLPLIVVISSALMTSHYRPPSSLLSTQSPQMLSRVIDDYYDAYAKEDRARMLAFYADEALFEDPTANLRAVGKAELTKLYDSIGWDDYADLSWKFEGRIFATDRVALEGTVSGLYRSKPFSMRIATNFIFKKGKIVHHLDLVDYVAFREQMKKG